MLDRISRALFVGADALFHREQTTSTTTDDLLTIVKQLTDSMNHPILTLETERRDTADPSDVLLHHDARRPNARSFIVHCFTNPEELSGTPLIL